MAWGARASGLLGARFDEGRTSMCMSGPSVVRQPVIHRPSTTQTRRQSRQTVRPGCVRADRRQQQQQKEEDQVAQHEAATLPRPHQPRGQLNNALPKVRRRASDDVPAQLALLDPAAGLDVDQLRGAQLPASADTADVQDRSDAAAGRVPGQQAASGSVVGAIALITGSTVGAGILALPAVTAPAGFLPSTATMVGVWMLLAAEALLLAEANLAIRARQIDEAGRSDGGQTGMVTLHQMAEATFGQAGASATSVVYLGLSYSLLIAYIAKASTVISSGSGGAVSSEVAACVFTSVMGSMLWLGGARAAEAVNGVLTAALLALFCAVVVQGGQQADLASLGRVANWGAAPACVPIVFLSLVYHDLVPVICDLLGGDRRRVATALLGGSLLPLAMFLTWNAVTLAIMPSAGLAETQGGTVLLDPLEVLTQHAASSVGVAIGAFSVLAIATSFIGTTLGLASTISEELKSMAGKLPPVGWLQQGSPVASLLGLRTGAGPDYNPVMESTADREATGEDRGLPRLASQGFVYALVLGPPLQLAVGDPAAFFGMLNMAGAYGMTVLYGVAPPLMVLRLRQQSSDGHRSLSDDQQLHVSGSSQLAATDRPSGLSSLQNSPEKTAANGQDGATASMAGQHQRQAPAVMLPGGSPVLIVLCVVATGITLGRLWTDVGAPSKDRVVTDGAAVLAGLPAAILSCF